VPPTVIDEEWSILAGLLPLGWADLARPTGAIRRDRGITDPAVLLQLLLLHAATGLSLKQTVARAKVQALASITDVGLLKRLRTSESWLRELARRMFEASRFSRAAGRAPDGYRLRAVDATTVEEPGATGTDWRVHFSISLPELACDFYELTDVKGSETYQRLPVAKGDIILGDRGYCHRAGVAHVVRAGGDVIVRLHSTAFPLLHADGRTAFALLPHLRTLPATEPGEWSVCFRHDDTMYAARVCAIRKTKLAADQAKQRIRHTAKKKQRGLTADSLECAEYIFVLTTAGLPVLCTDEILDAYRARWQIELCFKRLKSLLQLGHLPKRSDDSARAWIQAKLLTVLLIEALLEEARFFSPWGYDIASAKPVA
jgi:Transposase DDE domain